MPTPQVTYIAEKNLLIRRGLELLLREQGLPISDTLQNASAVLLDWSYKDTRPLLSQARSRNLLSVVFARPMTPGLATYLVNLDVSVVLGEDDDLARLAAALSEPEPLRLGPDLAGPVNEILIERGKLTALSPREVEVLGLAGDHDTEEIAYRLDISPWTVRNHIQNIMTKLEATTRTDLMDRARNLGYVD